MKTLLLSLAALAFVLQQSSCNNDHPRPRREIDKLPPETQSGKYTFGCLVNGKAWYNMSTTDAYGVVQNGIIQIAGGVKKPIQSIGIVLLETDQAIGIGTYSLVSPQPYDPRVTFFYSHECWYGYGSNGGNENTLSGNLTITRFDRTNYIISGRFEFTTWMEGCDTLRVTDGRFDIRYIP